MLTFLALQTKPDICAYNVDPDEMAHKEPSHQYLHCMLLCFYFDRYPCLQQWSYLSSMMEESVF